MVKKLQPIGNSLGLIIDRPILELLGITAQTQLNLEVSADGKGLVIRPLDSDEVITHKERVRAATKRVMKIHRETLKKLAE